MADVRTVGVVTVARSDYGIYRPVLRLLRNRPGMAVKLFVGGAHLSPEFGGTVREVERDGFPVAARVKTVVSADSPEGTATSMGRGVLGFARAFARHRPDILLVLGDRFEMFAAAAAAVPFNIPLAHLHGGERTEGAIDEAFRHAITKMSHLHFVAMPAYRDRVIRMGEAPWRVFMTGAPAIDNLRAMDLMARGELEKAIGFSLDPAPLLVTYHPVTREREDAAGQVRGFLAALAAARFPILFTYPNADAMGRSIIRAIERFARNHGRSTVVPHLGTRAYFSLMKHARAMVGNSSSGILEAASFRLPVVNVGNRQKGRFRPRNVIDVADGRDAVLAGIRRAVSPSFRRGLRGLKNPYGDGHAAERIVRVLARAPLGRRLIEKEFFDAGGKRP